ncbi:MAG: queuosine precursor transporter [Paracoccaceae bacterium]|tara:strand:+ start:1836 stop:2480 length:645 start_codon:yes stop_codon:yes gene_type:complete
MEQRLTDNKTMFIAIIMMAAVVILSNVLVQFYLGAFLTYGAFTYPIAFLINDVVNKLEGPKRARKVILWGFVVGVFCSLIGSQIEGEFGPLVTLRIAIGSGLAFLIAHLSDTYIFHFFRKLKWWVPPLVSSTIGSALDTFIFFSVAFSLTFVFIEPQNDVAWANEVSALLNFFPIDTPFWISMAIADFMVKIFLASLFLIPFRRIILSARQINV